MRRINSIACLFAIIALVESFSTSSFSQSRNTNLVHGQIQHKYTNSRLFSASLPNPNENVFIAAADNSIGFLAQESAIDYTTNEEGGFDMKTLNTVINTSVIAAIVVAVLYHVFTIDAGMMRGWTIEEEADRMIIDNWNSYLSILHSSPIATKAVTSATVYTIGDIIAQKQEGTEIGELDRGRVLRSLLAGFLAHGPMCHVWYNVSENVSDNVLHLRDWWGTIVKVAMDQSIFSPIWNNTYILLLGLMKMDKLSNIFSEMKRTTIPLMLSGLKLWPAVHVITYGFIPVENRLLWVDFVEIIWVTILATSASGANKEKEEN